MPVYSSYGKRLIRGFDRPSSILTADKEAILLCLVECRKIWRKRFVPKTEKNYFKSPLRRYFQKASQYNYPLEKLDVHVNDIMEILLSGFNEQSMCRRIHFMCKKQKIRRLRDKVAFEEIKVTEALVEGKQVKR